MVSWLTLIMGSPGNSIRNRREICCGNHHWPSQEPTWAASRGPRRPGRSALLKVGGWLSRVLGSDSLACHLF